MNAILLVIVCQGLLVSRWLITVAANQTTMGVFGVCNSVNWRCASPLRNHLSISAFCFVTSVYYIPANFSTRQLRSATCPCWTRIGRIIKLWGQKKAYGGIQNCSRLTCFSRLPIPCRTGRRQILSNPESWLLQLVDAFVAEAKVVRHFVPDGVFDLLLQCGHVWAGVDDGVLEDGDFVGRNFSGAAKAPR